VVANWYIVHAMSGSEKRVVQTIKERAVRKGLSELIEDIVIPSEKVVEVRRGQKVDAEKKLFPGYILIKMEMNDETWHLVKGVPKVTGFLGNESKPQVVSEAEVKSIFNQIEAGAIAPRSSVEYEVGESVKVIDGPFESFVGLVEEVDKEKSRLKVSVSIFGRATPIDLDFTQVIKNDSI
jgi:transcriptional antiterminator NusG